MIDSISDIERIQIQSKFDAKTDALTERESDLKSLEARLQSIEDEILALTLESNADNTPRLKTLNKLEKGMRKTLLWLSNELHDRRQELQFLQTLLLKPIQGLIGESWSKQGD